MKLLNSNFLKFFFFSILIISCKVSSKIDSDFATFFEKSNGTETPDIKTSFEDKLKKDADFAKNPRVQLDFVFKNSPHYEKAHLRLPIFKVN
jgi:hypothetical protein